MSCFGGLARMCSGREPSPPVDARVDLHSRSQGRDSTKVADTPVLPDTDSHVSDRIITSKQVHPGSTAQSLASNPTGSTETQITETVAILTPAAAASRRQAGGTSAASTAPTDGYSDAYARSFVGLEPNGTSLMDLELFLRNVWELNGGRCSPSLTIQSADSIWRRLYCIQCRCSNRLGRPHDVLFFASQDDHMKHHRMCESRSMQGFLPDVIENVRATEFRDRVSGILVRMPPHMITAVSTPVDDVLNEITRVSVASRSAIVHALASQLLSSLAALHGRRIVHCGVMRCNVVRMDRHNASTSWAFREMCRYQKAGREPNAHTPDMGHNEVAVLSPEAAAARFVQLEPSMDIWQLGVMLYELYTGNSYWPPSMSKDEVLRALARHNGMPHEADPTKLHDIRNTDPSLTHQMAIIAAMLDRDPKKRPTALEAQTMLDSSRSEETLVGTGLLSVQRTPVLI